MILHEGLSQAGWEFDVARPKTRYWKESVAVGAFSRNTRFSVVRRLFLLSWRCFSGNELWRSNTAAFCKLFRWSCCISSVLNHQVYVDGEKNWDLPNVNVTDETFWHTVTKITFTNLQQSVVVLSCQLFFSLRHATHNWLSFGPLSATVPGKGFFQASRCSVTSKCLSSKWKTIVLWLSWAMQTLSSINGVRWHEKENCHYRSYDSVKYVQQPV